MRRARRLPQQPLVDQIIHAQALTWQAIADEMNCEGFPTAQGGRQWYTSTAQAAYWAGKRRGL
jgi:hypothetical protein